MAREETLHIQQNGRIFFLFASSETLFHLRIDILWKVIFACLSLIVSCKKWEQGVLPCQSYHELFWKITHFASLGMAVIEQQTQHVEKYCYSHLLSTLLTKDCFTLYLMAFYLFLPRGTLQNGRGWIFFFESPIMSFTPSFYCFVSLRGWSGW